MDIIEFKLYFLKEFQRLKEPWKEEHLIIDTANKGIEECINELINNISNHDKKRQF